MNQRILTMKVLVWPETVSAVERSFWRCDDDLLTALLLDVGQRYCNDTYWNRAFADPGKVSSYLRRLKDKFASDKDKERKA